MNYMNPLSAYGWTKELDDLLARHTILGTQPARVVADFGTSLKVALPKIVTAELSGALAHHTHREQVPKVGDWVLVRLTDNSPPVIEALLPRQSEIARKVAGSKTLKQVIAANVDVAFVLLALDNDFSIDRLRRFLYQLSINAIKPVIVLNKADKVENAEEYISQLSSLELPVIAMVATKGTGMAELLNFIAPGKTAVLLGSSGVGKSTLTNRLLERDVQKTHAVRQSDDTGMHTTVHRELFMLPGGGLLIDMPGIRELQLWGTEEALDENFDDIAALFRQCKYASCQHKDDDGCAVQRALKDGTLDPLHYAAYQKMKNELSTLKQRSSSKLKRDNERSKRTVKKQNRDLLKDFRNEASSQ